MQNISLRSMSEPLLFFVFAISILVAPLVSPGSISASETTVAQLPPQATKSDNTSQENESPSETPDPASESPSADSPDGEHEEAESEPLIKNDAIIFGILMMMLGIIFYTSSSQHPVFKNFYKVIPMLLVCYFLPSLLTFFGLVDHHESNLYFVATRYLLPATLVLLTLSIDLGGIFRLGPKALIMFLTGTFGVVVGGPVAVIIVSYIAPDIIGVDGPDAVWRGLSTVAGSWIGGGANQAAMQVVFMTPEPNATTEIKDGLADLYSVMVAVDVFVAEVWMLFLLLGVGKAKEIDRFFKADASSIEALQMKMEKFSQKVARIPTATDLMVMGAIAFGATALAHFGGESISSVVTGYINSTETVKIETLSDGTTKEILHSPNKFLKDLGLASSFFWLIVISTTVGIVLSFTPCRNYEGAGASKLGTVFIFILVAVIGMGMDIRAVVEHPGFFLVGGIWMVFHVALMFLVGWLIRAPYFFLAVGSKANIGGAASAPVVAAAFHPALAPVGVLLAVLGYALGTYGAMMCAWMMQMATPAG